jgi:signal transduction histidine kinase
MTNQTDLSIANAYLKIIEEIHQGIYDFSLPDTTDPVFNKMGQSLQALANDLLNREIGLRKIDQITTQINAGMLFTDVLERIYNEFHELIPYDRIGVALIEEEENTVRSVWAKSCLSVLRLKIGYKAALAGSSLETISHTQQPRIINNLQEYLCGKPDSNSTRLIVEEGMRSSLTCPLIARGKPLGFIFFTSSKIGEYTGAHVEMYQRIARYLSVMIEKAHLVSELAEQREAYQAQNFELRKVDKLKNHFLGMTVHDLRNPLSYIQTVISLLTKAEARLQPGEKAEFLKDIQRQVEHMLKLIDNILDITQIEAGQLNLRFESIPILSFLEELARRHNQLSQAKDIRVYLDDAPDLAILADPLRLRQVLDNLVSNAVKYSPPGSRVWVSCAADIDTWRFCVKDEGPGIKPSEREKLFQEFSRLSARPTGNEKSTGLGLAIVKRIIEAHGGQVGVETEQERGAEFWFTIPRSVNHP